MTIRKNCSPAKRSSEPTLFDWAAARKRWDDAGYPAHKLARDHGLPRHLAMVVAVHLYGGDKR